MITVIRPTGKMPFDYMEESRGRVIVISTVGALLCT